MSLKTLIVALEDEGLCTQVLDSLDKLNDRVICERIDPRDWAMLLDRVASARPQSLLLDVSLSTGELGTAIREIHGRSSQTKVIAVHPQADSESILAAMRAGASEFVHPPFGESLFAALDRISTASETGDTQRKGKLIAFLSAKGGCGATTLACHVAPELNRQTGSEVLLADFDFTSGVIGFLMKTNSTYSVLDAVKNISRLDESLWKALVTQSRPGLCVLPAPTLIGHGDYPDEQEFRRILRFMRTQHDWTVIDLGRSLTRTAKAVLEEADDLFLVSTLEVIALHGVKTILASLANDPASADKVHLVLNRTPKMMDITVEELQKILGKPLYASLPNDYPGLYHSYASGTLLPANNHLAEHFSKLASRIAGKELPKVTKKRFALFG